MPIDIRYNCTSCGWKKPESHDGMICPKCEGDLRPEGSLFNGRAPVFDAGYDPTLKKEITSFYQQEKEMKKFRSKDHPKGLVFAQDNHKFMKRLKDIKKNKPDYVQQELKRQGVSLGEIQAHSNHQSSGRKYF